MFYDNVCLKDPHRYVIRALVAINATTLNIVTSRLWRHRSCDVIDDDTNRRAV